ncbi:hypothetical protein FRC12_023436 [Ceratobasidium sp. 428]|nr:hypothetical protein FRC12_023436 [Ceratobasidium sp. 428]
MHRSHDTSVAVAPLGNLQRATINSRMDAERVVSLLDDHGCQDITHEIDFSTITNIRIRRGGFGQVRQAQMRDGGKVAIKALFQIVDNAGEMDCKTKKRAGREGYNWSKFKHPNILRLLGVARLGDEVVLVSPWIERGTLSEYILRCPGANLCDLASQVADGLAYMHSIGAIHGDIKGANVLVSDSGTAMLTDFGNTVLEVYSLQFTPTGAAECTVRWASPEILDGKTSSSMKGDVWALAMTVLSQEIVTGKPPYSNLEKRAAVIYWIMSQRLPLRPNAQIPPGSSFGDRLWTLLTSCWTSEPSSRPTAAYVRDCLKDIVATEECTSGTGSPN